MLLANLVPEQVPRSLVSLAGRPASPTSRLSRHTKSPNPRRRITDGLGAAERNLAHISFHSVERPNSGIRSPTTSSPPSFGRPKTGHGPNHLKKGSLRDWGPERDCVRETLTGYKAGRQEFLFGGVQLGN
ncbi:uncharacterized protein B0T23DRAFT_405762 [Neurospora hispaniola]|uniref:Uncharacterized protein n=1 Tax=Neurospora hispaniola TaxID=588809 RepID=A0AAJ0MQM2_9PEZI|nr:hypothetical protein B0T23DRAFT_405762 [Neurospora hispaniola]